jgi:hypothetical protein
MLDIPFEAMLLVRPFGPCFLSGCLLGCLSSRFSGCLAGRLSRCLSDCFLEWAALPVLLAVLLAAFPGCRAGYLYPWSLAILAALWLSFWLHFSLLSRRGSPLRKRVALGNRIG